MTLANKPSIRVIAFDADDTLWRNEELFMHAQEQFINMLLPYHDEAYIRSHLSNIQVKNLKHFGYGIKGFTLSMIETSIQLTEGRISGAEIHQIILLAKQMLEAPIELLPNIETVLSELKKHFLLMVITKGDLLDQEGKLARSGLVELFDYIEIVSDKTPLTYQNLLNHYQIEKAEFLMVGNSLKSDILPILDLDAHAVHIPYHSTWEHEQVSDAVLSNYPNLNALEHVGQLPEWIRHHVTARVGV